MALSKRELETIRAHPIGARLDTFRDTFKSTSPISDATGTRGLDKQVEAEAGTILVLQLLSALQSLSAALQLSSRIGSGPLFTDIASLAVSISSKSESSVLAGSLLRLVLEQAKDEVIWSAVFDLVDQTQPTTPPPSAPSFRQTPWSYNTGSLADTLEPRSHVDALLRQELEPDLRLDVSDVRQACFGHVTGLNLLAQTVFDRCQQGDAPVYNQRDGCWTRWPKNPTEDLVLAWLQELEVLFAKWTPPGARLRQLYCASATHLSGSTGKRKLDLGIAATQPGQLIKEWAPILVVGELKSSNLKDNYIDALVDLATYVREVFRAQDRRFVLGFTLCGSMMRLWHFDRLGTSGSCSFDINKDGYYFVHAMLGYFTMNDEQLGLDPTIVTLDGKAVVEIDRNDQPERLILTRVLRKQAMLIGRATTCWTAYREGDAKKAPLIVKDSWQFVERSEEGELIKEATDSGVRHVARYYHHESVQVGGRDDDVITNVRRDQMKGRGRTSFRQQNPARPEASDPDASGKILAGRIESQSSVRKRSSSSIKNPSPPKRLRSSQSRDEDVTLHNRVHRRVVTRDVGKPIQNASSLVALLNGLTGAINGHESLLNAGILHRDISTGNIMLTEDEHDGFLIDLDLAVRTSNKAASGAPTKTGTKIFMAIGALYGEHHTFMHDLESFFWVLFWLCIHWNGPGKEMRRGSRFEKWNYSATEELAESKSGVVAQVENFDIAVRHFSGYCQPLIPYLRGLRGEVFPGGSRWISDDSGLYTRMKATLEKARESLSFERDP